MAAGLNVDLNRVVPVGLGWLSCLGIPRLAVVGALCLFGPLSVPTKSCFPFHSERYFRGRRRHEEEPEEEEKRR